MSTAAIAVPEPVATSLRASVVIEENVTIPDWVVDLDSYRRWAYSDAYPQSGWVSFLDGKVWVDMSREELFSHNQVKLAFTGRLCNHAGDLGDVVPDRMFLTNRGANLATEPDLMFFFWATMKSGKIRMVMQGEECFELEGTPDMALEIISKTSVRKDRKELRELYWKAGVLEYWLVDARGEMPKFDILRQTPAGYVETPVQDGWLKSEVFGRQFQLVRETDPLGHPLFVVNVKEVGLSARRGTSAENGRPTLEAT